MEEETECPHFQDIEQIQRDDQLILIAGNVEFMKFILMIESC
jgi:hypothetical protein